MHVQALLICLRLTLALVNGYVAPTTLLCLSLCLYNVKWETVDFVHFFVLFLAADTWGVHLLGVLRWWLQDMSTTSIFWFPFQTLPGRLLPWFLAPCLGVLWLQLNFRARWEGSIDEFPVLTVLPYSLVDLGIEPKHEQGGQVEVDDGSHDLEPGDIIEVCLTLVLPVP